MKFQTRCRTVTIFLALAVGESSAAFAQVSLTPPGPPAATIKSLAQIGQRVPISSVPYTIGAPGSYYLTTNLSMARRNAITFASSDVTLDLNGFTFASTANVLAYPDNSSLVEFCTVQLAGGIGIAAANVRNCVETARYSCAIYCSAVADREGQSLGSGAGTYAQSTAQNCYKYSNSALAPPQRSPAPGIPVGGATQNCYG